MQIKSLRMKSYTSWSIADRVSEEAIARIKKLEMFTKRKAQGYSTPICLEAINWSKVIYYRWLKRYQEQGWQGSQNSKKSIKS